MPLTYVSFSYLSKVNLGGKFVYWTRTLSQDSCSLYEPMHPHPPFPLTSVLPISLNRPGYLVTKKMQITWEPMPNFFLVLDLFFMHLFYLG